MRKKGKKLGFTLLELLTVIAIMAALSTMAVTSYFGAIRGMARRSAIKHFASTLVLAKQRAMMEGTRMSVLIYNEMLSLDQNNKEDWISSYVIVRELGQVSKKNGDEIYDEFTPLNKYFGYTKDCEKLKEDGEYTSIRLYNIDNPGWSEVYPKVFQKSVRIKLATRPQSDQNDPQTDQFAFVINTKISGPSCEWSVGDHYGIEVSAPNSLPRKFSFAKLEDKKDLDMMSFTFLPNGDLDSDGGSKTVKITEKLGNNPSSWKYTEVKIEKTGDITYDDKKWR